MSIPTGFIPFHRPSIGEEEIQDVVATLRSGWITTGPRTRLFEHEFARYVQAPCSLAVNSCTAALHLALVALDIGAGDEVITTPLTFCATLNTILQVGATPVLADIGVDGNIDPASIAARITPRARAIVPVHLAGLPCDMEAIWRLAQQHGLAVVEDAAHAVGSRYHGAPVGAADRLTGFRSDVVAFSFYATKNLTTGEGGMVTTHDPELIEKMRILCLHGISKDAWNRYAESGAWFYQVTECGFKYNLSDIQSAIGIHQLRKQERFLATRTAYAGMYHDAFANISEFELPPDSVEKRHCWHLYCLRLNLDLLDIDRAQFIAELKSRGIGASVHFIPIPLHPLYERLAKLPQNHCPRALGLYPRLVSLPLYPAMTEDQVRYVCETVRSIVLSNRRTKVFAAGRAGHASMWG